jgi:hypothetical protein
LNSELKVLITSASTLVENLRVMGSLLKMP